MIKFSIEKAFSVMKNRKWDCIYFAIDLHDTIIKGTYSQDDVFDTYPNCIETLKLLTETKFIKLILFTSSFQDYVDDFYKWAEEKGIKFDYFNENPECGNTVSGDFSKKFYYNVMIDDKAGFNPEIDWRIVKNSVEQHVGIKNECICYSSSSCHEGKYFLIRNDCPIHQGNLR